MSTSQRMRWRDRARRVVATISICIGMMGIVNGSETAVSGAAVVMGRVIDVSGDLRTPLGGVEVRIEGPGGIGRLETLSDVDGGYVFPEVEPGPYLVSAGGGEMSSFESAVEIDAGATEVVDIPLSTVFKNEVTVTATRTERETADVPASVTVVGEAVIRRTAMTNIEDALGGIPGTLIESRNRGYDARLIIRGAGLKARYGIREIMVMQDGIPITDPDSLTRLDMVDTHLVESVEVVRGPNSTLWGINSTGGVVNIITRSPFDDSGGTVRADAGTDGSRNFEFSLGTSVSDRQRLQVSGSRRQADNPWRPWNRFDTTQFTLRPGLVLGNGTVWESTLSYTKANLQLPGRLVTSPRGGVDQWTPYIESGDVARTADPWKHSGRYSEVFFFGSKLATSVGEIELKPTLYVSRWKHHHPVTAKINGANSTVGGIDLQIDWAHGRGVLTGGVTFRADHQQGVAFSYADTLTSPEGRVLATLSDEPGGLMRRLEQETELYGAYIQESWRPGPRWLLDLGCRVDRLRFQVTGFELVDFDYARGRYVTGRGPVDSDAVSTALSPRVGALYRASDSVNVYGSVSTGTQTPTIGEVSENPDLGLTQVVSFELGLKLRRRRVVLDAAAYHSPVRGEIVQVIEPYGTTGYVNAGRTDKTGFEVTATWHPGSGLGVGGAYSYSEFVFRDFSEPVYGRNIDRSGNRLPYVPAHQYSVFASYAHPSGLNLRVSVDTWGRYFVDNANSETYDGYLLATDLFLGYRLQSLELGLILRNVFDDRYAVEVQKDLYGTVRSSPVAPRSLLARIAYRF